MENIIPKMLRGTQLEEMIKFIDFLNRNKIVQNRATIGNLKYQGSLRNLGIYNSQDNQLLGVMSLKVKIIGINTEFHKKIGVISNLYFVSEDIKDILLECAEIIFKKINTLTYVVDFYNSLDSEIREKDDQNLQNLENQEKKEKQKNQEKQEKQEKKEEKEEKQEKKEKIKTIKYWVKSINPEKVRKFRSLNGKIAGKNLDPNCWKVLNNKSLLRIRITDIDYILGILNGGDNNTRSERFNSKQISTYFLNKNPMVVTYLIDFNNLISFQKIERKNKNNQKILFIAKIELLALNCDLTKNTDPEKTKQKKERLRKLIDLIWQIEGIDQIVFQDIPSFEILFYGPTVPCETYFGKYKIEKPENPENLKNREKVENAENPESLKNRENSENLKNLGNPEHSEILKNLENRKNLENPKNLKNRENLENLKNLENPEKLEKEQKVEKTKNNYSF